MQAPGVERKLTAILSADVKGYSRLMGEDEVATVQTLTAYRGVMASLIRQHRGRVVDSPGDNLLAEFASVVDVLQCAVEIQQQLKVRNAALPEHRRMEFRIGINLGDVIVERERIYGDGVNIAARVEGLAEGGGISISGTVYDQVKNKLVLGYDSLGEHTVKNIAEPVRVYRIRMEPGAAQAVGAAGGARGGRRAWRWVALGAGACCLLIAAGVAIWSLYLWPSPPPAAVVSEGTLALEIPDKPSIAVLPFENLSGDPEQEYFSDGITEDLITDLSKLSGLFVIARNSVFTYKDKPVKVQQVSQELGVQYVLEGSVRKADGRVRITAQLVDATTGHHLWAERYDRDLKDVFALQDEITQKIVAALAVTLTEGEEARLGGEHTGSAEAYDYFLRGTEYYRRTTREGNLKAREMFERAIELDPEYGEAYAALGWTYFHGWTMQWSQDPQTLEQALELAQRSRGLDDSLPGCRLLLGLVYLWKKQYEEAIAEAEWATALAPNDADAYATLGDILSWAGRPEETIRLVEKAMRLNPRYPFVYLWGLGHAYYLTGDYEAAIVTLKRVLTRNPDWLPAHAYLAVIYSELGRKDEARAELAEVRRLSPELSLESLRQRLPYKDEAVLERFLDGMRKAGV
ncbi:MAG: tetratricopeptide repeat protein [Candidatus Methylomirabilia bacterium]